MTSGDYAKLAVTVTVLALTAVDDELYEAYEYVRERPVFDLPINDMTVPQSRCSSRLKGWYPSGFL